MYRNFKAGEARYIWLIDVNTREEHADLYGLVVEAPNDNVLFPTEDFVADPEQAQKMRDYVNQHIHGRKASATVRVRDPREMTVVDLFEGKRLSAKRVQGEWLAFDVEMDRLGGRLIALYPSDPKAVRAAVNDVTAGNEVVLSAGVNSGGGAPIKAVFPLQVELTDPNGTAHPWSRFTATNDNGTFEDSVVIGKNAPKGQWTFKVVELSTGLEKSRMFNVTK